MSDIRGIIFTILFAGIIPFCLSWVVFQVKENFKNKKNYNRARKITKSLGIYNRYTIYKV